MNTISKKQKKINFISPSIETNEKDFFSKGPYIINEFANYFEPTIHANKKKTEIKSKKKFSKDTHINIVEINTFSKKTIRNLNEIKRKKSKQFFFINYPYHKISILYSFILRRKKSIIWVRNDPKDQFVANGNTFTKPIRFLMKPLFSLVYDTITKFIFKDNLVFYTSSITTDKKNHLNQYEIISCSEFNRDKKLIKNEFTNKIFFVGGEENQKGLDILLKALQGSNKELNIIGMEKIRRKKNKKLARNVNIQFHGKIYQRKTFYDKLSQADIVVMPSYGEKQGKVQLEAMSVGAVPICSDSGGTYRTIDNYYNGLLFKEGSWKQLQKQIQLLYKDKELYERLKQNGLEYISELSVEKQVKKMAEIINNYYKVNE